jgi:hypothetical protein
LLRLAKAAIREIIEFFHLPIPTNIENGPQMYTNKEVLDKLAAIRDHCLDELKRLTIDGSPPEQRGGWKGAAKVSKQLNDVGYEIERQHKIALLKRENAGEATVIELRFQDPSEITGMEESDD